MSKRASPATRWLWRSATAAMDTLVAPSFGAPGYRASRRLWSDADDVPLNGRAFLVTGANAGLGRATTRALAARGATVHMLCRNAERGEQARQELADVCPQGTLKLHLADVSDLDGLRAFAARFRATGEPLHALVHNAGALLDARQQSAQGVEMTFATHVAGPFLLTHLLTPVLAASAPARVVFVSSGGMYAQRLDVAALRDGAEPYDGVVAYAQAKRAQVVLARVWNDRLAGQGVSVSSMHPGWVDTAGVRDALPRFHRLTKGFLRTPEQGADTIVWLAAAPGAADAGGGFYFDRKQRREHLPLRKTRASEAEIAALWALSEDVCGVDI